MNINVKVPEPSATAGVGTMMVLIDTNGERKLNCHTLVTSIVKMH